MAKLAPVYVEFELSVHEHVGFGGVASLFFGVKTSLFTARYM